mmetsp:Transcript_20729/g.30837  ORF Transcript_20729/g.30837 Transcript_20729/m.30837 type:complete len:504 (-) Transcript_20729:49-1560(-)
MLKKLTKTFLKALVATTTLAGGGLYLNYHLSEPWNDAESITIERYGSSTPVVYPSFMETQTLLKFFNSIGDSAYNLFGKRYFPIKDDPSINMVLSRLEEYISSEEILSMKKSIACFDDILSRERGASPIASVSVSVPVAQSLMQRLDIEKSFREHQQILDQYTNGTLKFPKLIIITGQARTGSTFLHQLMASDPSSRCLTTWEQIQPLPWPTPDTYPDGVRYEKAKKDFSAAENLVKGFLKGFQAYHDNDGAGIEEEYSLLFQTLLLHHLLIFSDDDHELTKHLTDASDKRPNYEYLKKFITLNHHFNPSKTHMVLKTPMHGFLFSALLDVFRGPPESAPVIVITHRHPRNTVPSIAKLTMLSMSMMARNVDGTDHFFSRERFGSNAILFQKKILQGIEKGMQEVHPTTNQTIVHVDFKDIIERPIDVVKKIYEKANITWTPQVEQALKAYIKKNKQERETRKLGSKFLKYSLEEFNLTEAIIDEAFKDYIETYESGCWRLDE